MGRTRLLNYTCFSPSTEFISAVFLLRQKIWLCLNSLASLRKCRKWWHRPQSLISCPLRAVYLFSLKVVTRRNRSLNSVVHSWNGIIHSGPGIIVSSFYRAAIGVEDKITGKERWQLTDRRGKLQYRRWTPTYKSDVTLPIIDDACSCGSFVFIEQILWVCSLHGRLSS